MSVTRTFACKLVSYCLSVLMAIFTSCSGGKYMRDGGMVWNTTYSIVYESDAVLTDSIKTVMRDVELSLSPFNKSSLITAINMSESDEVDSLIAEVFRASQQVNGLSGGVFDPTLSPLINLWGFGYDNDTTGLVSKEKVDSVMSLVGIMDCRIENGRMIKKTPFTTFNFSAITKGLGCDEVGRMLTRNGCRNFMVEIGGEIALSGLNPNGDMWHIQIDAPVESDTSVIHQQLMVLELTDCGIATSGNYRNFKRNRDGKRIGHTISPITGYPVETITLSATVIAPTCMLADALATACMAMDSAKAIEMVDGIAGVSCMLVTEGADGKWNIIKSSRFPAMEKHDDN